jgi:hypothetical protein
MKMIVNDAVARGALERVVPFRASINADPPCRQIGEFVMRELKVAAAVASLNGPGAQIAKGALLEAAGTSALDGNRRRDARRPLAVIRVSGRQPEMGVLKAEIPKHQVLDESASGRVPFDVDERRQMWRHHLGAGQVLTRKGKVVNLSLGRIQVPFAWRVQSFENILDNVTGSFLAKIIREYFSGLVGKRDDVVGRIHREDREVRVGPKVVNDHFHVFQV